MAALLSMCRLAFLLFVPSCAELERLVRRYAGIAPEHLTGTAADAETSAWLASELSRSDLEVEFQSFEVPGGTLWIPDGSGDHSSGYGCQLIVDDAPVPCYVVQRPSLDAVSLEAVPMRRVLVRNASGAYIYSPEDVYRDHLLPDGTLPFDAGIVLSTGLSADDTADGITEPRPWDWDQATSPTSRIPLVTVSPAFHATLANATQLTSLSIRGRWLPNATSRNVLARPRHHLPAGCDRSLGPGLPIYIGTPINGFFRAAGERGAGVALLVELARDLVDKPLRCPEHSASTRVRCRAPIFGFTSGHEAGDPGISVGVIPYLQRLGASLNLSLAEIPFISVGACLGSFEGFAGARHEGPGRGVTAVRARTSSQTPATATADALLDTFLTELATRTPFAVSQPGVMNQTNTEGAILQALRAGMPAMNLASGSQRFHLPADAGLDAVNFTALRTLTSAMSSALRTALCSGPLLSGAAASEVIEFV